MGQKPELRQISYTLSNERLMKCICRCGKNVFSGFSGFPPTHCQPLSFNPCQGNGSGQVLPKSLLHNKMRFGRRHSHRRLLIIDVGKISNNRSDWRNFFVFKHFGYFGLVAAADIMALFHWFGRILSWSMNSLNIRAKIAIFT
jgi:hypothetical protein